MTAVNLLFDTPIMDISYARFKMPMAEPTRCHIFFGTGNIDDWCAWCSYLGKDGHEYCAKATDMYYFERLEYLGLLYGYDTVYQHLYHIFVECRKDFSFALALTCYELSLFYKDHARLANDMFLHVYYGMVAEENKQNTKIGRLIKMNGLYSLLKDRRGVMMSTKECVGRRWRDIEAEANMRGIYRLYV